MHKLVILLFVILLLRKVFPLIENAAGSPGTLVQLATSSVYTLPYAYSPWYRPVHYNRPQYYNHYNRPQNNNYDNNTNNNQITEILPWLLSGVVLWKFLL